MLENFSIGWVVLGDLDCYREEVGKFARHLELTDIFDDITNIQLSIKSGTTNYGSIRRRIRGIEDNLDGQQLKDVFEKFVTGAIEKDDEDLLATVNYMQERYVQKKAIDVINESGINDIFDRVQAKLRKNNIFIGSKGELEDYYSEKAKQERGTKDLKAIKLSYLISETENGLNESILHVDEFDLLKEKVFE